MLNTRKKSELENSESRLTYLIGQLKHNIQNEEINRTYNRMLIERAVVRKKLKTKKRPSLLSCLCEKICRINKPNSAMKIGDTPLRLVRDNFESKLICDYFKKGL